MTFDEMVQAIIKNKYEEKRAYDEHYVEVVVARPNLKAFLDVLQDYFGPPFKPAGKDPSQEAALYAEPYGGVRGNQTMYFRKTEQGVETALLWPWGCGTLSTLKIIRR